jgi:hypothetical protein
MTLKEIQLKNNYSTDKESTHRYLEVYDKLFAPFQNKEINLLEVGVATGGSLKLWEDYFSKAFIWGVDMIDEIIYTYSERVIFWQDDFLKTQGCYAPESINIAIDDGSHFVKDQIAFVKLFYPILRKDGMLIIEDVFDIDGYKKDFDSLGIPYEIVDLRVGSGVSDSVLLIFKK